MKKTFFLLSVFLIIGAESYYLEVCSKVNCLNGGNCVSFDEIPTCECAEGFWGPICQFSAICDGVKCDNGKRSISKQYFFSKFLNSLYLIIVKFKEELVL